MSAVFGALCGANFAALMVGLMSLDGTPQWHPSTIILNDIVAVLTGYLAWRTA